MKTFIAEIIVLLLTWSVLSNARGYLGDAVRRLTGTGDV